MFDCECLLLDLKTIQMYTYIINIVLGLLPNKNKHIVHKLRITIINRL